MHKDFYAGGFLFYPDTEQILLQQSISTSGISNPWVLLGGISNGRENPEDVFKKTINTLLDIKIDNVFPVYSYSKENIYGTQHIFYAEIETIQNFPSKNNLTFAWFLFKEIPKINASDQTKHDIVVGQRVIEAAIRRRLGLHSF